MACAKTSLEILFTKDKEHEIDLVKALKVLNTVTFSVTQGFVSSSVLKSALVAHSIDV